MKARPFPRAVLPRVVALGALLSAIPVLGLPLLGLGASGCSSEVKAYEKKPKPTGKAADVPPPPTLPQKAKKAGDAYTVFGIVHDFHSKVHAPEVKGKRVSVVGYIVRTNLVECKNQENAVEEGCVPQCAVPKDLKNGTPADCKAPAPTFWIADSKDETKEMIPVMCWASNFAGIKAAMEFYDKNDKEKRKCEKNEDCAKLGKEAEGTQCTNNMCVYADQNGKVLPDPIPAKGAKVKITTEYSTTFKGFGSPASDPKYGILGPKTSLIIEVLEPAPELATLPYAKDRKQSKDDKGKDKDKGKEAPKGKEPPKPPTPPKKH